MENLFGFYLFTNYRNVGPWTNEIQGQILCSVLFGGWRWRYGTGDFVDFLTGGVGAFLALRIGALVVQRVALAWGGT